MKVRVNYIRRSEVFSRLKISAKNIIFFNVLFVCSALFLQLCWLLQLLMPVSCHLDTHTLTHMLHRFHYLKEFHHTLHLHTLDHHTWHHHTWHHHLLIAHKPLLPVQDQSSQPQQSLQPQLQPSFQLRKFQIFDIS